MPTTISARALKVTAVLDPTELAMLAVPDGRPRITLHVRTPDRTVTADLASKSVRKAQAAIAEHGPEAIALILQGKLAAAPGADQIAEAGLVAQLKAPKPVPLEAAAEA
jgi:hypothetical protein